jgi:hypothetical protein
MQNMRTIILSFVIFILAKTSFGQSEISLFDQKGNPVAYIATNDEWTIYLWEGKPVAYIIKDGSTLHVYGFNGKHLGWYLNGIIRDHDGNVTGFKKEAVPNMYENYENYKGYKDYKPYKAYREYAPYQPYFSSNFSSLNFKRFLYQGVNETSQRNKQIFDAADPVMETDLELLEKVNVTRQALFDQRTKNVQEVINQISIFLNEIYKYDKDEYKKQYATLTANIHKINTTPIDYSDINQYNGIIIPLKNHLSIVKDKLSTFPKHVMIQRKISAINLRIAALRRVDAESAKRQEAKLSSYVATQLGENDAPLDDVRYRQLLSWFDNFEKDIDDLIESSS